MVDAVVMILVLLAIVGRRCGCGGGTTTTATPTEQSIKLGGVDAHYDDDVEGTAFDVTQDRESAAYLSWSMINTNS